MKSKGIEGAEDVGEIAGSTDLAELVTLTGGNAGSEAGTPTIAGTALRVRVSQRALDVTKRDKGVRHRFGVYQDDGYAIGTIALHIESELYVVSVDLGSPEVRSAMAEACAAKRLQVILLSETGETKLVLLPAGGSLQALWEAAQRVTPMDVPTFVRTMSGVINRLIGAMVGEMLLQDRASVRAVHSSYTMSETLVADLERRLSGDGTNR
jgi:hypothetical protein